MAKFLWVVERGDKHTALSVDSIMSVLDIQGITNVECEWWYEVEGAPKSGSVIVWMQGEDEFVTVVDCPTEDLCRKLCVLTDSN